jgi:GT2 family glycosyltransferase
MEKIGVGIITCNRESFFEECFKSLPHDKIDCIVVINDGRILSKITRNNIKTNNTYLIENENNLGVGKSKNKALQFLLDKECDHIFILEDDLIIKDKSVFNKYIETSKA